MFYVYKWLNKNVKADKNHVLIPWTQTSHFCGTTKRVWISWNLLGLIIRRRCAQTVRDFSHIIGKELQEKHSSLFIGCI